MSDYTDNKITADFFKGALNSKFSVMATTGQKMFTEVYGRLYKLLVVGYEEATMKARFLVSSVDIAPSGVSCGNPKGFGSVYVKCEGSVESTLAQAVRLANKGLFEKYQNVIVEVLL